MKISKTETGTLVTNTCSMPFIPPRFSRENSMEFNVDFNKFQTSFQSWRNGQLIQVAFYYLSDSEREFLITGCTPEIWNAIFPE